LAVIDPRHESVEALIAAADSALYRAKQAGRNRVEVAEG
jgi:PleD family two-component response regulator